MSVLELYDATLRDGMGGGGMTLTAEEKLRVVHALDELGVHMIEAGFPASNPKERELFDLLSRETLQTAEVVAFGMTRRRGVEADEDRGLRTLADSFAPICTLVGKSSCLARRAGLEGDARGEPADDRRVGRVSGRAGQARAVRRRALLRRLCAGRRLCAACARAAAEAGGRAGGAVRHQRRVAAGAGTRGRRCDARGACGCRPGDPHPRRHRLRGREHAGRGRSGRDAGAGHDQRHRRAHRQRQPGHDRRGSAVEDGS